MHSIRPRTFNDDGQEVTIDLHGCSVNAGLDIVRRTAREAYRRGRAKLEVIHGTSTSDGSAYARTIKNELHRALDSGEYRDWISGHTGDPAGGRTTLWVNLNAKADSTRIRVTDILPPGA